MIHQNGNFLPFLKRVEQKCQEDFGAQIQFYLIFPNLYQKLKRNTASLYGKELGKKAHLEKHEEDLYWVMRLSFREL